MEKSDRIGMIASGICAVHCLSMPALAAVVSATEYAAIHNPYIDVAFLLIALIVGPITIWQGYRRHHSAAPAIVFAVGFLLVAFGIASHMIHHDDPQPHSHLSWTAVGGLVLVMYHLFNAKLTRKACCDKLICTHQPETLPNSGG